MTDKVVVITDGDGWVINDGTGFGIRDLPVGPLQRDPTWI